MKKIKLILLIASLLLINLVSANLYYNININYNKGEVKVNSIDVIFSNQENINYANEEKFLVYSAKIIDNKERVLAEDNFNLLTVEYYDIYDEETELMSSGGEREIESVSFDINMPYYENSNQLVIYDENKNEVARKSIAEFSKVDREALLKEKEKLGEEPEIIETEKAKEVDKEPASLILLYLLIIAASVLIIVIVYILTSKPKKHKKHK